MPDAGAVLNRIAETMLLDYIAVYYVSAETSEFTWYSFDNKANIIRFEQVGKDFFKETTEEAMRSVYEDDKYIFTDFIQRDYLISHLAKGEMKTYEYRDVKNGEVVYHAIRVTRSISESEDYFVLGVLSVDKEIRMKREVEKAESERELFNTIAGSLASKYDMIYYLDLVSGKYVRYSSGIKYGCLETQESGDDFFNNVYDFADRIVHPMDRDRVLSFVDHDYLLSSLESKKHLTIDYRINVDGEPQYTRATVMMSSDRNHLILGIENIDEEVRREQERARALDLANELARRDGLTGVKNKSAYKELESKLQERLDSGIHYFPFGILMCDINDLKMINDTYGHVAGDEAIKKASKLICTVFAHSPVFRVGGDEFVVFLNGDDYQSRHSLLESIRTEVKKTLRENGFPIIATGLAVYDPEKDKKVTDVFNRADTLMYENKSQLKGS